MKRLIAVTALLFAGAITLAHAQEPVSATFINGKGDKIGSATLKPFENGTLITVDVNLPAGPHAIHIHQKPLCETPDFKSSGGHFNPEGHHHGYAQAGGFHAGDLPNLFVESTGHVKTEIFSDRLHLTGPNGLANGAAIVIHEKGDDYSSDPAGDAGSRIACAVIK